jgi:hypothetical protein
MSIITYGFSKVTELWGDEDVETVQQIYLIGAMNVLLALEREGVTINSVRAEISSLNTQVVRGMG